MTRVLAPLPDLQLDPRNTQALLRSIQTQIFLKSNGVLTDFSPASPLSALTEGQAFAQSELLFYLNNLPEAFVLQWLKLLGVQRVVGSYSYAELIFIKEPGYVGSVFIPQSTEFISAGGLKFILTESVEIDSEGFGVGIVQSAKWGQTYNVPEYSIVSTPTYIEGLSNFFNPSPATGGTGIETVNEMKSRALTALSRRALITKQDFLEEIYALFPEIDTVQIFEAGDINFIINSVSPNTIYFSFAISASFEFTPEYVITEVLNSLKPKTPLGVSISYIPPQIERLQINCTIEYNPRSLSNLEATAASLFTTLKEYFSFQSKPLGSSLSISEIQTQISNVIGVDNVLVLSEVGSLKLFMDYEEPTLGGCSDDYQTILDENGNCVPNYNWSISQGLEASEFFGSPLTLYSLFELNVFMINSNTTTSTSFKYKNAQQPSLG